MILSVTGHHFWERLIQIVFTVGMWNFDTLIVVLHRSHQWNGISIHQQINELSAINLTFSDFIAVTGHPRQIHISNRDCFWTVGVRNIKFDLFQNWNRNFLKWQTILQISLNEYFWSDEKEMGKILVSILIAAFENGKIITEKPNLNES